MKILSLAALLALCAVAIPVSLPIEAQAQASSKPPPASSGARASGPASAAAVPGGFTVTEPWIRATVAQQKSTGLFMQLSASAGGRLLEVKTPVAAVAEIHEMKMDGDVMRMRPLPSLALPAGKSVMLAPGGYHVMLMELKQQLKVGDNVPLTLIVEGSDGKRQSLAVQVPVRPLNPDASAAAMSSSAAMPAMHGMKEHKH